ncbi:DUF4246-containing protein [Aureococcus anophagefferens]|nr:DUF4246-containing protein [Aureococcus anophagefferens]
MSAWSDESLLGWTPNSGDVVVATAGKSGTTWMQQIITQLLAGGSEAALNDFGSLHELSPWVSFRVSSPAVLAARSPEFARAWLATRTGVDELDLFKLLGDGEAEAAALDRQSALIRALRPRVPDGRVVLKTHEPFSEGLGCPCVFVARDGLDGVLASRFLDLWLDDFRGYGAREGVATWAATVKSYWDARGRVRLVHFSDLKRDARAEAARVAAHCAIAADDAVLDAAVAHSAFAYMKRRERWFELDTLEPGAFLRGGADGGGRAAFSDAQVARYEAAAEALGAECARWLRGGCALELRLRALSAEMRAKPEWRFAGRRLQVIVKLQTIELTPERPEYAGGAWHVEGTRNERIVATAIHYLECENISESRLAFREAVCEPYYEQEDHAGVRAVFDMGDEDPLVQPRAPRARGAHGCGPFLSRWRVAWGPPWSPCRSKTRAVSMKSSVTEAGTSVLEDTEGLGAEVRGDRRRRGVGRRGQRRRGPLAGFDLDGADVGDIDSYGATPRRSATASAEYKAVQRPTTTARSSEIQIALFTARIKHITQHVVDNPKDHASRRGLLTLVSSGRLLNYYHSPGGGEARRGPRRPLPLQVGAPDRAEKYRQYTIAANKKKK